jgi:chromosome segregation ATPase
MTITTEEAERLAIILNRLDMDRNAAALRSLAAERDALKAELDQAVGCIEDANAEREQLQAEAERLKAGGCARDQSTTQFCAEAVALKAENARLREAMEMARECLEDKDVIGAKQTLTLALGETQ